MVGADGRPLAETLFRWIDPKLEYWRDRAFALRAPFVFAARLTAEPFDFRAGRLETWRPAGWTTAMGLIDPGDVFGVGTAIVAPAYLPRGVIGAVVWARTLGPATTSGSAGTALALGFTLLGAWIAGDLLRRVHLPRRARDAACVHTRQKVGQIAKLHRLSFYLRMIIIDMYH